MYSIIFIHLILIDFIGFSEPQNRPLNTSQKTTRITVKLGTLFALVTSHSMATIEKNFNAPEELTMLLFLQRTTFIFIFIFMTVTFFLQSCGGIATPSGTTTTTSTTSDNTNVALNASVLQGKTFTSNNAGTDDIASITFTANTETSVTFSYTTGGDNPRTLTGTLTFTTGEETDTSRPVTLSYDENFDDEFYTAVITNSCALTFDDGNGNVYNVTSTGNDCGSSSESTDSSAVNLTVSYSEVLGCDGETLHPTQENTSTGTCQGSSYTFDGRTYTVSNANNNPMGTYANCDIEQGQGEVTCGESSNFSWDIDCGGCSYTMTIIVQQ